MNEAIHEYDPSAGMHISRACQGLAKAASAKVAAVAMTFNNIRIVAQPNDAPEVLESRWQALGNERRRVYRQSDEYRRQQRERQERLQENQKLVSAMMEHRRFETLESTLDWLEKFTPAADDIDVKFSLLELADALTAAGYVKSEFVGDQYRERLERDADAMGRYIVGQVISCLEHGMPPHPMATTFIERWRKTIAELRQAERKELT